MSLASSDQYFGSRRLAVLDQLGSAGTYYPWGEAKGNTNPQDTWSYATYWRDSLTGLDYANNRYYSNQYGRFMTPDPYQGTSGGSGDADNPQSWNRYAYTVGDPVNWNDPDGEFYQPPQQPPNQPLPPIVNSNPGGSPNPGGTTKNHNSAPPPPPPCNPTRNPRIANNLTFVEKNYQAAVGVAAQQSVPVSWILGWAGVESGQIIKDANGNTIGNFWGQLPQAQSGDNNFFGLVGGPWQGQVPCPNAVTNSQGGTFACFNSFSGSATAALSGVYGNALRIDAAAGQSANAAFYEVADLGYFSNPVAYGQLVQSTVNQVATLLDCFLGGGY